jgi:type VI protein secretion system component VasF
MSLEHPSPTKARRLAEEAIGEAMDDLAQRHEERARREAADRRWTRDRVVRIGLIIAVPLLVAILVVTVWSPSLIAARLVGSTVPREQAEAVLREVVEDIQSFHEDYAELPVSLAEVGLPFQGDWRYTRITNDRYHLELSLGGHAVTFDGR